MVNSFFDFVLDLEARPSHGVEFTSIIRDETRELTIGSSGKLGDGHTDVEHAARKACTGSPQGSVTSADHLCTFLISVLAL